MTIQLHWMYVFEGFFMTKNMYPVLARSEGKTARAIIIVVLACHAVLSLIFKFKFFSYKVVMPDTNPDGGI